MSAFSLLALAAVFVSMFGLGLRLNPQRLTQEMPKFSLVARALVVALVAVPILAVLLGESLHLGHAAYLGLLLVGISPGAPLALRRSHDSGGRASFAMVLQVVLAILAIFAVPAWVWIVDVVYGASADIALAALARQVAMAQLLPLGLGAAVAIQMPERAAKLSTPMLRLGALMVVVVALIVLWEVGPKLPSLGILPFVASGLLTIAALGLGHWAGGPEEDTRTVAAVICAMRNPGIALLVASTNRLPKESTLMVLAHVLLTALLLVVYLAMRHHFFAPL